MRPRSRPKPTKILDEKVRSSLKLRLQVPDLAKVPLGYLERLVKFLGLPVERKDSESDGPFRHRLMSAICRWEKEYQMGQR